MFKLPLIGSCFQGKDRRQEAEQVRVQRKKNDQGHHECEVFACRSEISESACAWNSCSKNPGHEEFIPVRDFCISHLPRGCQEPRILEYVRNISAGTVRVRVSYTSGRRPRGYSFYTDRGSDILHTGSGWLYAVSPGDGLCQCPECVDSSSSSSSSSSEPYQNSWFKIYIDTACHVVYNSEEARATRVDFFYDDESARAAGWVRSLHGLKVIHRSASDDWCRMVCATHDQALAEELKACLARRAELWEFFKNQRPDAGWQNLCIIVSHPHGQPKQITVGKTGSYHMTNRHKKKFLYSTPTCPGSSGAPVLVMDDFGMSNDIMQISNQTWTAPHSEGNVERGLNRSGASCVDLKARSVFIQHLIMMPLSQKRYFIQ